MKISFTPTRSDRRLTVERAGDVLTLNGEAFDFSALQDGDRLPRTAVACEWLASDVSRDGGVIRLTLLLPHGPDAPQEARFPTTIALTNDGPVTIPAYSQEVDA